MSPGHTLNLQWNVQITFSSRPKSSTEKGMSGINEYWSLVMISMIRIHVVSQSVICKIIDKFRVLHILHLFCVLVTYCECSYHNKILYKQGENMSNMNVEINFNWMLKDFKIHECDQKDDPAKYVLN